MTAELIVSGVGTVRPEGFDFKTALGRRGYKYLPTASQYFLAAAKRALADIGQDDPLVAVDAERRAAAVGTNSAAASLHDAMDRTVMETGAAELSPVLAPYFSINLFGSRLAMEHELKGFNVTFVSPGSPVSKPSRPVSAPSPPAGPAGCWPGPPNRCWPRTSRGRTPPRPGRSPWCWSRRPPSRRAAGGRTAGWRSARSSCRPPWPPARTARSAPGR
ncbi:hypothetical protein SAZ11_36190 [Streptomyces sp. FXJ1.4098]|nr:hypothetical protein [Streptomyces sp. FXJ1.4098]